MNQYKNYLITGGAGFIGGTFISKILSERKCFVHNIDKINYASDMNRLNSIKNSSTRYEHYKLDLLNFEETKEDMSMGNMTARNRKALDTTDPGQTAWVWSGPLRVRKQSCHHVLVDDAENGGKIG